MLKAPEGLCSTGFVFNLVLLRSRGYLKKWELSKGAFGLVCALEGGKETKPLFLSFLPTAKRMALHALLAASPKREVLIRRGLKPPEL